MRATCATRADTNSNLPEPGEFVWENAGPAVRNLLRVTGGAGVLLRERFEFGGAGTAFTVAEVGDNGRVREPIDIVAAL